MKVRIFHYLFAFVLYSFLGKSAQAQFYYIGVGTDVQLNTFANPNATGTDTDLLRTSFLMSAMYQPFRVLTVGAEFGIPYSNNLGGNMFSSPTIFRGLTGGYASSREKYELESGMNTRLFLRANLIAEREYPNRVDIQFYVQAGVRIFTETEEVLFEREFRAGSSGVAAVPYLYYNNTVTHKHMAPGAAIGFQSNANPFFFNFSYGIDFLTYPDESWEVALLTEGGGITTIGSHVVGKQTIHVFNISMGFYF